MFFAPSLFFFILRVQFLGYTPNPSLLPEKKNKKKLKKNKQKELELAKCYTQL